MTLKDAALAYAKKGWKVFPIRPREKKPLTEHGFKDSTSEPETIEKWWTQWPDANIGLDCGGSGLFVIDVDDRDSFKKLQQRIGKLPASPIVVTGSGRGGHLFFKQPESEKLSNEPGGLKGTHIDVRGDGGYVILPPSVHPSGKAYEWKTAPKDCPLPEVPPALITILKQTPQRVDMIRNGKVLEGGGRNNYLFSFGISLVNAAMTDNEVRAKMTAENQIRCEPPLDDRELQTTINSALGYRGRTKAYLDKYGSQTSWRKITQAEASHLAIPPTEWDVDGLLPRDSAPTMLFGDGGSYKSWIALHLAACSATGEKAFGRFDVFQRSNSLFVNLDAGAIPLLRRLKTLGGDRTNLCAISPGAWNPVEFQKLMEANAGAFVVVDCFSDLFEGKAEGAAQAGEMRRTIKSLREQYERFGCGGFIIDHSKRSDDGKPVNPKKLIYGSTQKNATIRSMIHVAIVEPDEKNFIPDGTVRVRLTCVKQSEAETFNPFEVDITFPQGIATFTYVDNALLPEAGPMTDDQRLGQEALL